SIVSDATGKVNKAPFDVYIDCVGTRPEIKYKLIYTGEKPEDAYTSGELLYNGKIHIDKIINGSVKLVIVKVSGLVEEMPSPVEFKMASPSANNAAQISPDQIPGDNSYKTYINAAYQWVKNNVKASLENFDKIDLKAKILEVANEETYKMDPYLVASIVITESQGNPKAKSPFGYFGLMQTMDTDTDIKKQIENGIRVYKQKVRSIRVNNDVLATVAYNSGEGLIIGVTRKGYSPVYSKPLSSNTTFAEVYPNIPAFVKAMNWGNTKIEEIGKYYPKVYYSYKYLKSINYFGDVGTYPASTLDGIPGSAPEVQVDEDFPLKYGDSGKGIIVEVQKLLDKYIDQRLEYIKIKDYQVCRFGPHTTAIVKLYQQLNGLEVTGRVTKDFYMDLVKGKYAIPYPGDNKVYEKADFTENNARFVLKEICSTGTSQDSELSEHEVYLRNKVKDVAFNKYSLFVFEEGNLVVDQYGNKLLEWNSNTGTAIVYLNNRVIKFSEKYGNALIKKDRMVVDERIFEDLLHGSEFSDTRVYYDLICLKMMYPDKLKYNLKVKLTGGNDLNSGLLEFEELFGLADKQFSIDEVKRKVKEALKGIILPVAGKTAL
ncbi:MAG: transglycosylase SLT domain-containing protein, partial [Clostridiaceae bacterium]|nr:transglycosylase SLT domain-containing protein [Clostridiaceae bacterium]